MTINTIIAIVAIVSALLVAGAGIYFYIRNKTLDEIRSDVYKLFLEVENNPVYYKAGKQKMKWVLYRARNLLPTWAQLVISDEFLEKAVEGWFQTVKDLLDDGKLNKSIKEDTHENQ